jgi:tRNA(Ile)-lysidine synthase
VRPPLHPLESALLHGLRAPPLLPPGSKGLVSLSGGSDSTALLLLLHRLREPLHVELEVLHFNHGLRPESAQEAEWAIALANRLGLLPHLRSGFEAPPSGAGIQAAARAWRQEQSLALLRSRQAQWIATGHQRDDHLETLLMKLLRGVHLSRIRGLERSHGPWVRPLLEFSRDDLRGYLCAHGETWLEDPSNQSPKYRRNRVRHELLPLLDSLAHGGIAPRLLTLERQSQALAGWLASIDPPAQNDPSQPPHWIDSDALRALPVFARTAVLHEFVRARLPGAMEFRQIELAAELTLRREAWALHLGRGRTLRGGAGRVLLESTRL